ncbi:MAG: MATE family efflux transporter, partial [Planctomycetaceae bacterium]
PAVAAGAGLTGESADVLVRYVRWDAVGQLLFGFCLVGSAALRGVGDMRTPMYLLGGVNVLNIAVATLLVRGTQPDSPLAPLAFCFGEIAPWGVNGIVAATVAARLTGGVAMLALLARGIDGLKWRPLQLLPRRDDFQRLMRVGLPTVFEGASMWLGQWLFLMIISRLGT